MIEQFRVPDIACEHCVRTVTKAIGAVPGVRGVRVTLSDKTVRVEHDGSASISALIEAIRAAGYEEIAVLV